MTDVVPALVVGQKHRNFLMQENPRLCSPNHPLRLRVRFKIPNTDVFDICSLFPLCLFRSFTSIDYRSLHGRLLVEASSAFLFFRSFLTSLVNVTVPLWYDFHGSSAWRK